MNDPHNDPAYCQIGECDQPWTEILEGDDRDVRMCGEHWQQFEDGLLLAEENKRK